MGDKNIITSKFRTEEDLLVFVPNQNQFHKKLSHYAIGQLGLKSRIPIMSLCGTHIVLWSLTFQLSLGLSFVSINLLILCSEMQVLRQCCFPHKYS